MKLVRLPTLSIRRWLILALVAGIVVPTFLTAAVTFHALNWAEDPDTDMADRLRDDAGLWTDPAWQALILPDLQRLDLQVVLTEGGQDVFRTSPDLPGSGSPSAERLYIVEQITIPNTDPPLVALLYSKTEEDSRVFSRSGAPWQIPIVAVATLVLTLGGIGWFLGRTVVKPLAATSAAAHRVAMGDLDVALPSSRVSEVAEVNTAFTGMSAALRTALEQQSELEQQRRFFIAAIVHDLRTPLFSLRGYLEGMAQGVANTPEKSAHYLSVALEKAAALDRLISDLFSYTRLEYLDQTPTHEPVDLLELLDHLVAALQPQASTKSITLSLHAPTALASSPYPVFTVSADPHLLTRAFENILDNALRYTPPGGEVTVTLAPQPDQVTVSVSDTGPGIPTQDLPNLFAPLYRGESSRNRKTGGAGLGLAVSRRIILAHNGTLTAANIPRGGALFIATLPSTAPQTANPPQVATTAPDQNPSAVS